MEQTITIEVPEGKEIVQEKGTDGSIRIGFIDKEPVRSKSWEEFCKNHPDMNGEWFVDALGGFTCVRTTIKRSNCDSSHLSTKEDAEGILALIQLTRLHDEWVGDWKPTDGKYPSLYWHDITDDINHNKIVWLPKSEHHLLKFPTGEMAVKFLKCFEDLIEKAKKFI